MITIDDIKVLMQPLHHPDYNHTALLDPTNGKHALSIALCRWLGGAKQINLTQYELPPDAVGRVYTVDIFIGQIVNVSYTSWAKGVHHNTRGNNSSNNHKKGNYLTVPHITLFNLSTGKKEHFRPGVHMIVAYTYPPLREQYAQAVMDDMIAHNRSFTEACVQVNHLNKYTYINSAYNLEVITASDNGQHRMLATAGEPYSMLVHKSHSGEFPELRDCLTVLSDAPDYVTRMCLQLSTAQLPVDTKIIPVSIQSITGSKVKPVQVANQSIWGILTDLYTAHAHHICT